MLFLTQIAGMFAWESDVSQLGWTLIGSQGFSHTTAIICCLLWSISLYVHLFCTAVYIILHIYNHIYIYIFEAALPQIAWIVWIALVLRRQCRPLVIYFQDLSGLISGCLCLFFGFIMFQWGVRGGGPASVSKRMTSSCPVTTISRRFPVCFCCYSCSHCPLFDAFWVQWAHSGTYRSLLHLAAVGCEPWGLWREAFA